MDCLQRPDPQPGAIPDAASRSEGDGDDGELLACAFCLRPITTAAARIQVDGSHEHQCVNPHGLSFHIGCFGWVTGCRVVGAPSAEWSWFPPCRWQIELCGGCREHLGWLFRSADREFHGLILDRLVAVGEADRS